MAYSMTVTREALERAQKLESAARRAKIEDKLTLEKVSLLAGNIVGAPISGYIAGRFDSRDGTLGDGYRVAGFPVQGLGGALMVAGGLYMGGVGGNALAGLGLSAVQGELFMYGLREGLAKAEK